jgi:hypothetical protein
LSIIFLEVTIMAEAPALRVFAQLAVKRMIMEIAILALRGPSLQQGDFVRNVALQHFLWQEVAAAQFVCQAPSQKNQAPLPANHVLLALMQRKAAPDAPVVLQVLYHQFLAVVPALSALKGNMKSQIKFAVIVM